VPVQQARSPRFTLWDCLASSKRRMKLSFAGKWIEIILLNELSPAQMANSACSCSYMESTTKMIMTIMMTHECKARTVWYGWKGYGGAKNIYREIQR
jgi:hypothetical protein